MSEAEAEAIITEYLTDVFPRVDDWILEDVWEWIEHLWDRVNSIINDLWNNIVDWFRHLIDAAISSVKSFIDALLSGIRSVVDWIYSTVGNIWSTVQNIPSTIYQTIGATIATWSAQVSAWISNLGNQVWTWIQQTGQNTWTWLQNAGQQTWTWLQETAESVKLWGADFWADVQEWFTNLWATITAAWQSFADWWSVTWDNFTTWLDDDLGEQTTEIIDGIKDPIMAWWDDFMDKLPAILTGVWDSITTWLKNFWSTSLEFITEDLVKAVQAAFEWIGGFIGDVFNSVIDTLEGWIKSIAPVSPKSSLGTSAGLVTILAISAGGLAAMTIGGELLHPLKELGFGHVSAMIGDLINYKTVTGVLLGVMIAGGIKTPMTYYINQLLRPWLPDRRDFVELVGRRAFTEPEALKNPALTASVRALAPAGGEAFERDFLAFQGYRDEFYGLYKELGNARLGYFALAGIARTGFYDDEWFTEALHRTGYSNTAVRQLKVMYRKMVDENASVQFTGSAIRRFREGYTDEGQFRNELEMLGATKDQADKYVFAAELDYATDYTGDLLAAYRDAVRKGNLDLDQYRDKLLELGIVPQRVEAYVLRERARQKPEDPLTPLPPPKPTYETDAGRIEVDTIRRLFRKDRIEAGEMKHRLISLGIAEVYADAIIANDQARKTTKAGEED